MWTTWQKAIFDWATAQTNLEFVWANQNKPRPEYPFGVLNVIAETPVGIDEVCTELNGAGTLLDVTVVGHRRFTVSIQVHSLSQHPAENARSYLSTLRTSFRLPSVVDSFKVAGLKTVRTSAMQNLDRQIEGQWESMWSMDAEFGAAESHSGSVEFIEKVEVTDEISNPDNSFTIP